MAYKVVSIFQYKTETLLTSRKINRPDHPSLYMQDVLLKEVACHGHVGLNFSNDDIWPGSEFIL